MDRRQTDCFKASCKALHRLQQSLCWLGTLANIQQACTSQWTAACSMARHSRLKRSKAPEKETNKQAHPLHGKVSCCQPQGAQHSCCCWDSLHAGVQLKHTKHAEHKPCAPANHTPTGVGTACKYSAAPTAAMAVVLSVCLVGAL